MTESNIIYERGDFWIYKRKDCYEVLRNGITHSTVLCAFTLTEEGLSVAKAYVDYKATH